MIGCGFVECFVLMFAFYFHLSNFLAPRGGAKEEKMKMNDQKCGLPCSAASGRLDPHPAQDHSLACTSGETRGALVQEQPQAWGLFPPCLFTHVWKCLLFYFLPQMDNIGLTKLSDSWHTIIVGR